MCTSALVWLETFLDIFPEMNIGNFLWTCTWHFYWFFLKMFTRNSDWKLFTETSLKKTLSPAICWILFFWLFPCPAQQNCLERAKQNHKWKCFFSLSVSNNTVSTFELYIASKCNCALTWECCNWQVRHESKQLIVTSALIVPSNAMYISEVAAEKDKNQFLMHCSGKMHCFDEWCCTICSNIK